MGRVEQGGATSVSTGHGANRHHKQLTDSSKPSYKVTYEEVTQARKAQKIEDYHNIVPPVGYKFVAAGDPVVNTKCKELARLEGKTIYRVINTTEENSELSKQVHRIGFHFPEDIVRRALTSLGIDRDKEDDFLRSYEVWPIEELGKDRSRRMKHAKMSKRKGKASLMTGSKFNDKDMTQEEIDAEAKAAILDMFPAIPHDNLYQIILHSFEKGTERVGVQQKELSLPRRIQLAVVAHIRHVFTDYDKLLREKTHDWRGARIAVEPKTLAVLASWRGDKDDDAEVVEDILREVLVISDDEDEAEQDQYTSTAPQRHRPGQTGRSDVLGTGRQIWLDARERRNEPFALPQARADHVYYMPRPGQEIPQHVNHRLYEQRLRGLESYNNPSRDGDLYSGISHQIPIQPHGQVSSARQIEMHRQSSRNAAPIPLPPPTSSPWREGIYTQPQISGSISRPDPNVRTPTRSTEKGKLSLIPVTEQIMPSIETPRSERAPASAFSRGAIVIDSPPNEKRNEFEYLRRADGQNSPIKRKRAVSPRREGRSNLKEVIYLPLRDGTMYQNHSQDLYRGSDHHDKVVYIPLDAKTNPLPSYTREKDSQQSRYEVTGSTSQIYMDRPYQVLEQQFDGTADTRYENMTLAPNKQPQQAEIMLIPLDNHDTVASGHSSGRGNHQSQMLIPLDPPTQPQRYLDQQAYHRDTLPMRYLTEASRQRVSTNPDSVEFTQFERHGPRYHQPAIIPYDPHEPYAGLSQPRQLPAHHFQHHRRHDSGAH